MTEIILTKKMFFKNNNKHTVHHLIQTLLTQIPTYSTFGISTMDVIIMIIWIIPGISNFWTKWNTLLMN